MFDDILGKEKETGNENNTENYIEHHNEIEEKNDEYKVWKNIWGINTPSKRKDMK